MTWAPDYVTVEQMREQVRIPDLDDDTQVARAITAASRAIDRHCNRQFGKADAVVERLYTARPDYQSGYWTVDVDDLHTATGLAVAVAGDTVATWSLKPSNAAADGRPWTRLAFTAGSERMPRGCDDEVALTTTGWGWAAVPLEVEQACVLQAHRFLSRRNTPFGVAGSPADGSEMRLLSKVDPDVAVALGDVRRMRAAG